MHDINVPMIFYLFNKIDSNSARDVVEWIINANIADVRPEYLTLIICSDGGELASAFAIIDMMNSSNIPIRTIAIGEVQSSAFMIFMAGEKGNRMIKPNTSVLSHRFSAGSEGKFHDLTAQHKEFELLNERMITHYIKCTGKNRKFVEQFLLPHSDVYLTADEAVKLHCADKVG
jgi:ATP-dependent Clp protease protease subunit